MIVGEADIDVRADSSRVDGDLSRDLNRIASRAGERFGTLLGRGIGAPFRLLTRRAGSEASDELNAAARRAGDRFGTSLGRAMSGPFRAAVRREGALAGRGMGLSMGGAMIRGLTSLPVLGAIAALGYGAVKQFQAGLTEAGAAVKGRAQLDAALASTNHVVGLTAAAMENLAGAVQRKTGADDDAVVAAEGLLLTFTNVRDVVGQGNTVFSRAVVAARDLSVRGFGDLNATTLQLGKALNDPIRGVGALSRAGIQFTAGQRRTIEELIRANDVLGAQKLILAEVEKQVGGSGEAFGRTFPGKIAITRERFNNLRGEIVARFVPALMSALDGVGGILTKIEQNPEVIDRIVKRIVTTIRDFALGVRDMFSNIREGIGNASDDLGKIGRVFGLLGGATGEGSLVQRSLGGIGTLLGGLIVLWAKVGVAVLTFVSNFGIWLGEALHSMAGFVRGIDNALSHVADSFGAVAFLIGGPVLKLAVEAARKHFDTGLGDMADDIDRLADTMMLGGQRIGAALAGGIGMGLLDQAARDPALKAALDTILGAPVGIGISPDELNKYADGVKLRDSFFAGIEAPPTGSAPDGSGLIDDTDKKLSEAQKKAADRARALGNAVTQGIRDQLAIVKREVSTLTAERNKILDFRSSVLSAAGSFTKLSDLIDDPSTSTAARIAKALSNRLLGLQTFAKNLQILAKRGLDKGVIAELGAGGPEQRALSSALVAGTDEQIRALNATEKAVRQQQQIVAAVATDAAFGPHALDKANRELTRLNAQVATLNKQIQAQPALIAKAVEAARKNATVTTKTSTRTAVTK